LAQLCLKRSSEGLKPYVTKGTKGALHEIFIVEGQDGEALVLKSSMSNAKIKRELAGFLNGKTEYQAIIFASMLTRKRLKSDVKSLLDKINLV